MPRDKVLLVDDEKDFTQIMAKRLKARGLEVETACNGKEALEKAKHKSFDAVLLDLAMPGLDGIETLRRFKKINPELQIILLTGQATVHKSVEAMKLGAMDFLEKPADIQDLLSIIEEASTKTAFLMEKRVENQIADILRKQCW